MPGINITPHMQYNEDNRIKINVPFLAYILVDLVYRQQHRYY